MPNPTVQKNFAIPAKMAQELDRDLKRLGRLMGSRIQYMEVAAIAIQGWLDLPDRDKLTRLVELRTSAALEAVRSMDEEKTDGKGKKR